MSKSLIVDGQIYLYGDVGDPFGWGDGFSPGDVVNALAEHGPGDVTARINSPGGIATDGMAINSLFKAHAGKVTFVVDGIAASAASLIYMAGDVREMRKGAMLMIHDPGTITVGNVAAHQKNISVLDKLADNYASVYAAASGKKPDDARAIMKAETWYTADEAIAEKFATAVLDEPAIAMAAFDYRLYANAPRSLPLRMRSSQVPPIVIADPAVTARMRMRQKQI